MEISIFYTHYHPMFLSTLTIILNLLKKWKCDIIKRVFSNNYESRCIMYLINFSNSNTIFDRFNYDWNEVRNFLDGNNMDGVELIFHGDDYIAEMPKGLACGMHLRYYPSWLNFWRGNLELWIY